MRRSALIILLLLCTPLGSFADDKSTRAEAILKRAYELSNLHAADVGPYDLQANVKVSGPGRSVIGTYHLLWVSASQWREELDFPGYQEVRFGGKDKIWLVRPPKVRYPPAYAAFRAARLSPRFPDASKVKIKKIVDRQQDSVQLTCIGFGQSELCVDRSRGVLVSGSSSLYVEVFSDYEEFRGKQVPWSIGLRDNVSTTAVEITKLVPLTAPDPNLFVAPASAEGWETCEHPTSPKPLHTPPLSFRPAFGKAGQQSEAVVLAVITKTGDLGDLELVKSAYPNMDKAAIEQLSKWKFRPAMCGNQPIPVEILVPVITYQSAFQ